MSESAIAVPEIAEVVQFGTFHHPDRFLKTAELVALAFKKRADQLQLFKQIGPSKHLLVEGWQMLAAMYHVSAGLEADQYVTYGDAYGFEATYVAKHIPTGTQVSRATAMCLNTEENWGLRPRYEGKGDKRKQVGFEPTPLQQLRSMAQTRAESKCLSNLLKYVARMAGFATTPAEEMAGSEPATHDKGPVQQPQQKPPQQPPAGEPISDKQRGRFWGIAKTAGIPNEEAANVYRAFGFQHSEDITKDKYDEVIAALEARIKQLQPQAGQ